MKRGKKYREAIAKIDRARNYPLSEAVSLVKELAFAKFDETIELSLNLNLKKSQTVRDTLVLPNQFTGDKKILVFAKGDKAEEARAAGAAYVGDDDLIEKIKGGWLDFDVAVATPDMMKDVGRLGPVLGRRGLMPNPKTQTVTMDITGALAELQKGRVEFRSDKTGVVHIAVGKASMDPAAVEENVRSIVSEVEKRRPPEAKGVFVKTVAISSTMGPGVRVSMGD
ncbi:50S ribosomal protein L1 [Alkalispirochaeta sphaeroplastigenens]|uniref:Large ribosomal subunit protein uL1 n=1 Tax=Alkalispirochaeta sphaeroplastigenens TaxID=1187066 RepID=A0A2S4JGR5_9SPIO|nr:50S ribosomal protein L1 [Alkalispirochaeta sphaeroplastigenens]POQ98748.1 50S ribosomal protein L1 [Alkalispirochaeta sphaeroplastigenens]